MTNTGKLVLVLSLIFGGVFLAAALFLSSPHEGGPPRDSRPPVETPDRPSDELPPVSLPPREPAKTPPEMPPRSVDPSEYRNSLSGRVVNEQGNPVAGATVAVEQGIANLLVALKGESSGFSSSAKTDREGSYRFEGLPPHENYVVTAAHPDYAPARHSYVPVHTDQPTVVANLVLDGGYTIEGSVVDASKNPIANAAVVAEASLLNPFVRQGKADESRSAKTDGAGTFRITRIPQGQISLTARAAGYGAKTIPNVAFPQNQKTITQEIVLEEGMSIDGKVVDASGKPVANARIEATSYSSQNPSKGSAVSGNEGAFSIPDLPEGTYVLVVTAENYTTKRENRVTPGEPVTITLTPQGAVSGRVLAKKTGRPVASFSLEVRRPLPNGNMARLPGEARRFQSGDGSYTFPGLDPENQYVLLALAPGFAPTPSPTFTIAGPEPVTGLDILMSAGGTIEGLVVDAKTNQPVAGATVQTRESGYVDNPLAQMFGIGQGDSMQVSGRTDGNGAFQLANVAPGAYQVEIASSGFTTKYVKDVAVVEDGTASLGAIAMTSGGTITGEVYDSAGRPIAGAEVSVRSLSPGSLFTRNVLTDQSGRFLVRNLPPGDYQLAASAGSFHAGNIFDKIRQINESKKNLTVQEGGDAKVSFVVSN